MKNNRTNNYKIKYITMGGIYNDDRLRINGTFR